MDSRIRSSSAGPAPWKQSFFTGFTLIELLVVVSIMGLLIVFSEPSLHYFQAQLNSADSTSTYAQLLRRAQALAVAGRYDSPWGVAFSTTSITLYKGASYAARDSSFDEVYTPTNDLTPSGIMDVSFARKTGVPSLSGTTTIVSGDVPTTTVNINAKGIITY